VPATSISQSRSIARKIVAIDRRLEAVIKAAGPCTIGQTPSKSTNFQALADSILSQQLSIKAADTIIKRVKVFAGGSITAEKIARLSDDALRSAGCSSAKSRALRELASATVNREIPMRTLHTLTDEEIFTTLVPLFGIGQWTVEMFLIFQLGKARLGEDSSTFRGDHPKGTQEKGRALRAISKPCGLVLLAGSLELAICQIS
jgi:DNA-3-methyladenine glycosylase II